MVVVAALTVHVYCFVGAYVATSVQHMVDADENNLRRQ